MSFAKETALEVLGLPTFASESEILLKYRRIALYWFPERHNNSQYAVEQFRLVNEAACILLSPNKVSDEPLNLLDMYALFQNFFFGDNTSNGSSYEYDDDFSMQSSLTFDDGSVDERDEMEAAENAQKLILEEEQEKLKAERKKAKNKRKKERKKQQKPGTESTQKQSSANKQDSLDHKEKNQKAKDQGLSDSEEAIDPDSAFVAVIARKQKKLKSIDSKLESALNSLKSPPIKEDPKSIILRSKQLALRANEVANLGHFPEAISLFSESIKLDPSDHRVYGNRSYCYDRLNQFEKALKDAEKSIALYPWPKGYYRKGRALLGLKKYAESEECFIKVLKFDNDFEDAISELHNVRLLQIMEMGYSHSEAETALAKHGSVQESVESLMCSQFSKVKATDEEEVFISDDESDILLALPPNQNSKAVYDIKMDPNNPENHNSVWIGNIQPDVTEKEISSLFAKYGELLSVKVMPDKFCAFVNYKNKKSPGKAMLSLQGFLLHGTNIMIRFPNLPGETNTKKKPGCVSEALKYKVTEECYYWRTTGCIYGDHCRNLHVKEHKGIDKKKWHNAAAF